MADKENVPPTPPSGTSVAVGLRPWHMSAFASPPFRALSPNSKPALNRQRDHSACGRPETPLKVRKTRENLRDTRAYPELPPPCSHALSRQDEVHIYHDGSATASTLPSYHTTDMSSMPPPPLSTSSHSKMQRHKSVSRRMLSKVKQGINNRSKASLSIRPIESETSLIRRLSGRRKQSSEHERRAQSFEISRDSIVSTADENADGAQAKTRGEQRSFTDSTVSTSELMVDVPRTPEPISFSTPTASRSVDMLPPPEDCLQSSPSRTPRPLNDPSQGHPASTAQRIVVPCVELNVTTDLSAVDAGSENAVWVAIEAVVRGIVHPAPIPGHEYSVRAGYGMGADYNQSSYAGEVALGSITSLRLCYKPVGGCRVLDIVGQKALKDLRVGQGCTLFIRAYVPRVHAKTRVQESDQASLFAELESIVGTLETEVLHVEARYRCSILPYSNVVTVRHVTKLRRPKSESRWSIVGTYSDMETSEQMYTKLAIYLADSFPPEKALRYIDRYLINEAQQEPVHRIRQKVADELAMEHDVLAGTEASRCDGRKPTVVVTDVDPVSTLTFGTSVGGVVTAPSTPGAGADGLGIYDDGLVASVPQVKSRSTSMFALTTLESPLNPVLSTSKSTTSVTATNTEPQPDSHDDARRLWHHIRRSSLSTKKLIEMAPEHLRRLEASDEALRELRMKALANKRSVGAETLKGWKWDGQMMKSGEAPWL